MSCIEISIWAYSPKHCDVKVSPSPHITSLLTVQISSPMGGEYFTDNHASGPTSFRDCVTVNVTKLPFVECISTGSTRKEASSSSPWSKAREALHPSSVGAKDLTNVGKVLEGDMLWLGRITISLSSEEGTVVAC